MSEAPLEAVYRRWLWWYPREFRDAHADELVGVLLTITGGDRRAPRLAECLDLARGGLEMRLRPRIPRSDLSARAVVRLMYLVAAVECVVAVTVAATAASVRARMLAAGFTQLQWRSQLSQNVDRLVMSAVFAVIVLLSLAWCSGRGRRWARALFALNFALTTYSLVHGLAGGSAIYAPTDLAVGSALWLAELATMSVIVANEARRLVARARAGRPAVDLQGPPCA
jgi:hypothetical protein